MNWKDYIMSDDKVLLGKPVMKDTRISVEHLLSLLAQGWTEEQIFESYPRLTKEHMKALHSYVYECMRDGMLFTLPRKTA